MIDMAFSKRHRDAINDIGFWLDVNMPNPPLPEPQRWDIGYSQDSKLYGIRFVDNKDATLFALRWS
jgi:hypothetical protein